MLYSEQHPNAFIGCINLKSDYRGTTPHNQSWFINKHLFRHPSEPWPVLVSGNSWCKRECPSFTELALDCEGTINRFKN